jgi:hypothetical protein
MPSIEDIRHRATQLGLEHVEGEYTGYRNKMKFRCLAQGHMIEKSYEQLADKRGRGCGTCSKTRPLTEEEIIDLTNQLGTFVRIENTTYGKKDVRSTRKVHFICRKGHNATIIHTSINKAIENKTNGCKKCSNETISATHGIYTDVLQKSNSFNDKNIKTRGQPKTMHVSTEGAHESFTPDTKGNFSSVKIDDEGSLTEIQKQQIGVKLHRNNRNIAEDMTRDILQKLFGLEFHSTRKALISRLELDCFNDTLDPPLAIEYQGRQHYEHVQYFHKTEKEFLDQQARDQKKREECKELGITLIEVPHTFNTYTKIKNFLVATLTKSTYQDKIHLDHEWSTYYEGYHMTFAEIQLEKLRRKAKENGGILISTTYGGSYQKLFFKCHIDDHPAFDIQPNNIIAGQWCRNCNPLRPKEKGYYEDIITNKFDCVFISSYKLNFRSRHDKRQCYHMIEFECRNGCFHRSFANNLSRWIKKGYYECDLCK